jgi:Na+-translocating ferredoxin:NAD+ oxidoreductase subunit G
VSGNASAIRMMATLAFAGAVSGLVLVGTYQVTAPRIARNRAEALEKAVYNVLPGATSQSPVVLRDGSALAITKDDIQDGEVAAWAGRNDAGELVGYAIPAQGVGFQDVVALIYGFDAERRRVIGMEVLESKETPGLGDKIIKDAKWVAQFDDLAVDPPPIAVKKGKGTGAPNEIDAISGATISSVAVVKIIGEESARWGDTLKDVTPAGEER